MTPRWATALARAPGLLAVVLAALVLLSVPGVRVLGLQVDIAALYADRAGDAERPPAPVVVAFADRVGGEQLDATAASLAAVPGVERAVPMDVDHALVTVLPEALLDRARADGWALGGLETRSGIVVHTARGEEHPAVEGIRAALADADGAVVLGLPVLEDALTAQSRRDLPWLLGLAVSLMALGLAVVGRTWRAVVLPLAAVGLATTATIGLAGLSGLSLGGPNLLVPVVVLVFGLADTVYVVHAWSRQTGEDPVARAAATLAEVALPCTLTTATTAGSLLLLVPITSLPLGRFALLSSGGIVLALISGLALPILALRLWPGPTVRDLQRVPLGRVRAGVQGVRRLRVLWALCGVAVVAAGVVAAPTLRPTLRLLDELPATHPTRVLHEQATRELGGLPTLEVDLGSDAGVGEPTLYRALLATHGDLVQREEIGAVLSFAEVALWIGRAEGRPPEALVSRRALARGSSVLRAGHAALRKEGGALWALPEGRGYRLHARLVTWEPDRWLAAVDAVEALQVPPGVTVSTRGFVDVAVRGARRIPRDLWMSCLATGIGLLVVLAVGLRSLRLALWGLVPAALAVAATAAALALFDVGLTEPVVLAFALALGVGVDVWIHLSLRAAALRRDGAQPLDAAERTLSELLVPIAWTTGLLLAGLAALFTAGLSTPGDVAMIVTPAFAGVVGATLLVFAVVPRAQVGSAAANAKDATLHS